MVRETIKVELRIEEANHEVEFLGGGGRGIKGEGNRGEQSWGEGSREEGWENEIGDSIRDYGYVYLCVCVCVREREFCYMHFYEKHGCQDSNPRSQNCKILLSST